MNLTVSLRTEYVSLPVEDAATWRYTLVEILGKALAPDLAPHALPLFPAPETQEMQKVKNSQYSPEPGPGRTSRGKHTPVGCGSCQTSAHNDHVMRTGIPQTAGFGPENGPLSTEK